LLWTKFNLSKLFDCKQHFLRLVSIHVKEKNLSISICEPTIHLNLIKINSIVWKHSFMFLLSLKRTFHIPLKPLENQKFFVNNLLCRFICAHCHFKNVKFISIFINTLVNNGIFR
jgi:hypothetical protein